MYVSESRKKQCGCHQFYLLFVRYELILVKFVENFSHPNTTALQLLIACISVFRHLKIAHIDMLFKWYGVDFTDVLGSKKTFSIGTYMLNVHVVHIAFFYSIQQRPVTCLYHQSQLFYWLLHVLLAKQHLTV